MLKLRLLRCLGVVFLCLPLWLQAATPPKILVLGDSLSAAFGIRAEAGWVALLQERLQQEGYPHQVINASISGDTSAGGAARLPALLEQHQPQITIIELGANDGLRGLSLQIMRQNLNQMTAQALQQQSQVLLIGMQLPPNYGIAYTKLFNQTYQHVAADHKVALLPFLFKDLPDDSEHFLPDNLHPSEKAQPILLETVWPSLLTLIANK